MCSTGSSRAQGELGETGNPCAKPAWQVHFAEVRRTDYWKGRGQYMFLIRYKWPACPFKITLVWSHNVTIYLQPGDTGLFTCVATNTAGTARRDIRLSVNMRPAFKELPGDVTLNKGQSLTLSCHAQGTPTPAISWTANNRPYTGMRVWIYLLSFEVYFSNITRMLSYSPTGASVDESGRSSVIIDNVTVSDGGTYVCIAENTVGSIRALSFVRVRGMHTF